MNMDKVSFSLKQLVVQAGLETNGRPVILNYPQVMLSQNRKDLEDDNNQYDYCTMWLPKGQTNNRICSLRVLAIFLQTVNVTESTAAQCTNNLTEEAK